MQTPNPIYPNLPKLFSLNKLAVVVLSTLFFVSMETYADESTEAEVDCGKADIRYSDSPELTRAERLALMEKAFFDSVNRFESCQLTDPNSSSAESSNSNDSGTQGGGQSQGGNTGNDSVASQEMQGTEPESVESESSQAATDSYEGSYDQDESGTSVPSGGGSQNGAIPEDIPSANNDDAIASQIRLAAEAEQDPEIKKKLWNEYRKYKGMNVVED